MRYKPLQSPRKAAHCVALWKRTFGMAHMPSLQPTLLRFFYLNLLTPSCRSHRPTDAGSASAFSRPLVLPTTNNPFSAHLHVLVRLNLNYFAESAFQLRFAFEDEKEAMSHKQFHFARLVYIFTKTNKAPFEIIAELYFSEQSRKPSPSVLASRH